MVEHCRRGTSMATQRGPPHPAAIPRYRYTPSIPTPRIVSYNLRGDSSKPTGPASIARQARVIANMKQLMADNDILLVQETRTPFITKLDPSTGVETKARR